MTCGEYPAIVVCDHVPASFGLPWPDHSRTKMVPFGSANTATGRLPSRARPLSYRAVSVPSTALSVVYVPDGLAWKVRFAVCALLIVPMEGAPGSPKAIAPPA